MISVCRVYIHGGQDLKDGCFGDVWKLNIDFLYGAKAAGSSSAAALDQDDLDLGTTDIDGASWQQVKLSGDFPKQLAHHQGVLQEHTKEFIIYGGIKGVDSSDTLYVVDLKTFKFTAIQAAQQKEVNGKPLPGPRDDFCMVTMQGVQAKTKPVYLVGGFKNGAKMNDVYRLNQSGPGQFTWEFLDVAPGKVRPEPRSSFGVCLASETSFYLFGGSGDNNLKFNDLWSFAPEAGWTQLSASTPMAEAASGPSHSGSDQPLQKSGHQIALYKSRYILVFGGIHEVTYEMNDLKAFDLQGKAWRTIDEENKNASEGGSPKNKGFMQNDTTLKKNMASINRAGNQILNLDSTLNNTQSSPKKGEQLALGATSPSNRFNSNPFLTIKNRSLSQTKKAEAAAKQEAAKHREPQPGEELLTPTSISMKNAFIIKNADASFDHYYHMMRKRKSPHGSPSKLTGTGNIHFAPHHTATTSGKEQQEGGGGPQKIRVIVDKQPPGRDGHSAVLYEGKWVVFGGDRHHMPFNDTYVLDLAKLQLE